MRLNLFYHLSSTLSDKYYLHWKCNKYHILFILSVLTSKGGRKNISFTNPINLNMRQHVSFILATILCARLCTHNCEWVSTPVSMCSWTCLWTQYQSSDQITSISTQHMVCQYKNAVSLVQSSFFFVRTSLYRKSENIQKRKRPQTHETIKLIPCSQFVC